MKKNLLTLAAALLVATSAWAQNSFTVNGLNYQETGVGTGQVKITGYTTRPTGVLDIPETVSPSSGGSYTVTEIADEVFSECSGLTELVFPESLGTIGAHAFHYCQDLTSITCYNTTPPNVGESAFEGADKTIPVYVPANALSSYRSNAGWSVFTRTTYITFISNNLEYKLLYTSPNQAEIIGYTTAPTGVLDIPATVSHKGKDYTVITIAEAVFSECSGLTELVFPESLGTIGAHAFHYCQDLTSITCYNTTPPNVGEGAFEGADKTIPVYVPANALSSYRSNADWSVFTRTTYITFISNNLEYKLLYTSPNQAEIIGYTTTPTGVLDIPATVNHKGKDYTIITIAEEVFAECSGLTELVFPESLGTIGAHAFHYCQDLTSITCYNTTPPNVGEGAFEGADKTIPVYVPAEALSSYQNHADWSVFTNLQAIVTEFTVGGLTYKVTDQIAKTVEIIGYTTGLPDVLDIPATVTNNGINYNVTSIGADAIWGIDDLTEVSIPNSITTIGENVFWACYYMTKVTIGSGVTSIGAGAFALCEGLTEMTVLATVPPTLGDDAFGGVNRDIPVYVPAASLDTYKAAEVWKEFNLQAIAVNEFTVGGLTYKVTDQIAKTVEVINFTDELPNTVTIPATVSYGGENYTVTAIASAAFYQNETITEITISEGITSIGNRTFSRCYALTTVNIPASLTNMGDYTFDACTALTQINVASGNTAYCSENGILFNKEKTTLICYPAGKPETDYTIPSSVTVIGKNAFSDCAALTTLTIPAGVTTIESYAFYFCTALAEMTVLATVPPTVADADVFYNVNTDIPVYVPAESLAAYQAAEVWKEFNLQAMKTALNTPAMPESIRVYDGMLHNPQQLHLTLYDMQGRQVYSGNDATVSQPAGVYVVRCNGASGKVVF